MFRGAILMGHQSADPESLDGWILFGALPLIPYSGRAPHVYSITEHLVQSHYDGDWSLKSPPLFLNSIMKREIITVLF